MGCCCDRIQANDPAAVVRPLLRPFGKIGFEMIDAKLMKLTLASGDNGTAEWTVGFYR